jgi:hypothetical protein
MLAKAARQSLGRFPDVVGGASGTAAGAAAAAFFGVGPACSTSSAFLFFELGELEAVEATVLFLGAKKELIISSLLITYLSNQNVQSLLRAFHGILMS